jgi:hypothetical protein
MESNAIEIAKALVSPVEKLITMLEKGCGTIFGAALTKKNADATAYQINTISEAIRNNSDIPINYQLGSLTMNSLDTDDFFKRIGTRMAYQEIQKQSNIESVAQKAIGILNEEDKIDDTPIETGWINRFIDSVQYVDDDSLQDLWAKILAGEIVKPNSCSLRTLELIKNLNVHEAHLFEDVSKYILVNQHHYFLLKDNDSIFEHNEYGFDQIVLLQECGLLFNSVLGKQTMTESDNPDIIESFPYCIKITLKHNNEIRYPVYFLTKSGSELYEIMKKDTDLDDLIKTWKLFALKYNVKISIHPVTTEKRSKDIVYDENIILWDSNNL